MFQLSYGACGEILLKFGHAGLGGKTITILWFNWLCAMWSWYLNLDIMVMRHIVHIPFHSYTLWSELISIMDWRSYAMEVDKEWGF